ncbi:MAG: FAD-dependent oxidoreductase [Parachlamydiaceae bacterium]|nr:FAD-dependent oxidoreductase [Parachlamydiaceae bacterium]
MTFLFSVSSVFAQGPKVVVVGAGLAGLTTAYRLQQQGLDVHLYEARQRVGGRILTATVGGYDTELGGMNFCDGGEATNTRKLIEDLGLELIESKVRISHLYFDGEQFLSESAMLKEKVDPVELKTKLDKLKKTSQNMREVLDNLFDRNDILYKTSEVKLAGFEGGSVDKLSSHYVNTLYYMLLGGIAPVHQENLIDFATIKGGNSLLTETLAQLLGDRVHLNYPLTKVSKGKNRAYLLTFSDKYQEEADILVLAIPCSIYTDIVFEVGIIPEARLSHIKEVQYGENAKVIIPFAKAPEDLTTIVTNRVVGFFDAAGTILTVYYTGKASHFDKNSFEDVFRQEVPMLQKRFGSALIVSLLKPTYAKDQPFMLYDTVVGYSWPNDPYVKGSYAYIAAGQEKVLTEITNDQSEQIKTLFAPIDRHLYFVGEHTSTLLNAAGTMEAACESGERAARMIVKSANGQ